MTTWDDISMPLSVCPSICRVSHKCISEPGKALAQPSMALAMRILENPHLRGRIRTRWLWTDLIAELPDAIFLSSQDIFTEVKGAHGHLGRGKQFCLDGYVWSTILWPRMWCCQARQRLVTFWFFVTQAVYDRSMSYVFGCG